MKYTAQCTHRAQFAKKPGPLRPPGLPRINSGLKAIVFIALLGPRPDHPGPPQP